jgi:hypothetical protein
MGGFADTEQKFFGRGTHRYHCIPQDLVENIAKQRRSGVISDSQLYPKESSTMCKKYDIGEPGDHY